MWQRSTVYSDTGAAADVYRRGCPREALAHAPLQRPCSSSSRPCRASSGMSGGASLSHVGSEEAAAEGGQGVQVPGGRGGGRGWWGYVDTSPGGWARVRAAFQQHPSGSTRPEAGSQQGATGSSSLRQQH
jgi:hypothetical protein